MNNAITQHLLKPCTQDECPTKNIGNPGQKLEIRENYQSEIRRTFWSRYHWSVKGHFFLNNFYYLKNNIFIQIIWIIRWTIQHKSQPAFTCSKLTIETLDVRHRSGVFIVNFEHISHLVLVFLLLTLNMLLLARI